jgi:hypothetical protein
MWRRAECLDVSTQFSLEHWTRIDRPGVGTVNRGHIGDECASKASGQRRHEVARLVCMWKENQSRRLLLNQRGKRGDIPVGGIV